MTISRVRVRTPARLFKTRSTVAGDTPASRATSMRVDRILADPAESARSVILRPTRNQEWAGWMIRSGRSRRAAGGRRLSPREVPESSHDLIHDDVFWCDPIHIRGDVKIDNGRT